MYLGIDFAFLFFMQIRRLWIKFLTLTMFATALIGCRSVVFFSSKETSSYEFRSGFDRSALDERRRLLIEEAESWIGVPYCYGGTTNCFDCSGFTKKVYERIGIVLPRTAEEQSKLGKFVDLNRIEAGDLIFYGKGKRVTHVAIYAGNGMIIHSATSRGVVRDRFDIMSSNLLFAKKLIE
ncbi:MAG: hypothetical protein CH6_1705 [Candidatus Kapaibacterium sp.]|nr:MAG: hypothetical protein CH6_1705 [Candidatus Kapabacteria bacterium]